MQYILIVAIFKKKKNFFGFGKMKKIYFGSESFIIEGKNDETAIAIANQIVSEYSDDFYIYKRQKLTPLGKMKIEKENVDTVKYFRKQDNNESL